MVTRGHRLQGITSGYWGSSGLEVVSGGKNGLQGVTEGTGVKRGTGDNRGLQGDAEKRFSIYNVPRYFFLLYFA